MSKISFHPHSDWVNLRQLHAAMRDAVDEGSDTASGPLPPLTHSEARARLLDELTRDFPDVDAASVAADCDPSKLADPIEADAFAEVELDSRAMGLTETVGRLNALLNRATLSRDDINLATLKRLRLTISSVEDVADPGGADDGDAAATSGSRGKKCRNTKRDLALSRQSAIEMICCRRNLMLQPLADSHTVVVAVGEPELLVTVKIYAPLPDRSDSGSFLTRRINALKASQIVLLKGKNTLAELRDLIACHQDDVVIGDVSDMLSTDDPLRAMSENCSRTRDVYPSSMFHIGLGLYDDCRSPLYRRLSATVMKWLSENAAARKVFGDSLSAHTMESTRIASLTLRLGEVYLYTHAGNCEHYLVFADAALQHPSDIGEPLPRVRLKKEVWTRLCRICFRSLAQVLVSGCDELPEVSMVMCINCCRSLLLKPDGTKRVPFNAWCI